MILGTDIAHPTVSDDEKNGAITTIEYDRRTTASEAVIVCVTVVRRYITGITITASDTPFITPNTLSIR